MILDGQNIARRGFGELQTEIEQYAQKPTLCAFLIGNGAESLRYIRQKKKWAQKIGITFILKHFPEDFSQDALLKELDIANNDIQIHGIIVQLPLPKDYGTQKVIEHISPLKDVDGFTTTNQGKCVIGDTNGLTPCTPAGVMELLKNTQQDISGKNIVIIGKSNIVGKPLANLCINQGATVTVCNSKTKDISSYTKQADIIICATGKPHLLGNSMLGTPTVVIDVGFSVLDGKICGDCNFDEIEKAGHTITPVPGGVGPMTVLNLMRNTLKAYKNLQSIGNKK